MKEERSKYTNNKAKQHNTPKAVRKMSCLGWDVHIMRDSEGREERNKQGHTNNKAKQHNKETQHTQGNHFSASGRIHLHVHVCSV